MEPLVTVAMISRNMEKSLRDCLEALLGQTFTDFEIVIVDDRSCDDTKQVVAEFRDPRIRYYRNGQKLGYGATRNLSVKEARGKYIFFTDADCVPDSRWLEQGVETYQTKNCVGIVGKTLPLEETSGVPKRSQRRVINLKGHFMTCNMSFTHEILKQLGGFDPAFDVGQEDVEIGLRAKAHGPIIFCESMLVYHRLEPYTLRRVFTDARRYKTQVMIFKRYPNDAYHAEHSPPIVRGIFLKPEDWRIIFCPFLLMKSSSNQSLRDFLMIPWIYLAALYRRYVIWKTAFKERILLI